MIMPNPVARISESNYFQVIGSSPDLGASTRRSSSEVSSLWSSKSQIVIGGSSSVSHAILEYASLFGLNSLSDELLLVSLVVPSDHVFRIDITHLGDNWPYPKSYTQSIGDALMASGVLAVEVPSTVHQHEHNVVVNTMHRHFKEITIRPVGNLDFGLSFPGLCW